MMKLAVDELRDEFKQMAIEGGRQGAQMILNGEDMAELQQELENKERELLKLKMEKKKLENDLYSQKEMNEELKMLVAQKERQIGLLENEVKNINTIMNKQKKDLEKEQASRKIKEDELLSNIKDLKGSRDRLKTKLQMKTSAGNVSKIEMEKLRAQLAEKKEKPKERKNKKS
jgi:chromosome segregation ATPase